MDPTSEKRREGLKRRLPQQGNTEPAASSSMPLRESIAATSRPGDKKSSSSSSTRPPLPYDTGILHQSNICPVCEKCTVKELDRRTADVDPSTVALRARFQCDLCKKRALDLPIVLFDPWRVPGFMLYNGEDRFVPPVPFPAMHCTRCLKKSASFQCMTLYLTEKTKLPCEPACPPHRLPQVQWASEIEEIRLPNCEPDQLNPEGDSSKPKTKRSKMKLLLHILGCIGSPTNTDPEAV